MAGTEDDEIPVVHVWGELKDYVYCHTHYKLPYSCMRTGSPYEMGYAHGTLMKDKVKGLITDVWMYMESQVVSITTCTVSCVLTVL